LRDLRRGENVALNIRLNAARAGGDFNAAVSSRVRNVIEVGDRVGASTTSSSSGSAHHDRDDLGR
jgi:hypothetical protein